LTLKISGYIHGWITLKSLDDELANANFPRYKLQVKGPRLTISSVIRPFQPACTVGAVMWTIRPTAGERTSPFYSGGHFGTNLQMHSFAGNREHNAMGEGERVDVA